MHADRRHPAAPCGQARTHSNPRLVSPRSGSDFSLVMAEDALIVRGAREHNLRNVDVTIPRDRLTVITGLSGSGKSSLAFDTIYAEGQRRYVESLSAYARQFLGLMEKPDVDAIDGLSPAISIEQKTAGQNRRQTQDASVVVDRLAVRADDRTRLTDSLETALKLADGLVEVFNAQAETVETFSERYGCPVCGISMPELEPRHFSFNSPFGACTKCGGLGTRRRVAEELILGDPRISILEGVVLPCGEPTGYLRKA